ncbi:MAG: PSD1 and planctomycete cytochrome C domain-containing protein, partial [Acidobacteriota bacterium]|nr:PSD1 and planctomycete cytochrome C domain-containing protein [Acidobacteriota bacterium]
MSRDDDGVTLNMRRLFVLLFINAGFVHAQADEARTIFLKRVRPIFQEKCGGCHGDGQKLSGLSLSTRESVLRGGKRGPAVAPNHAETSLLIAAIEQTGALKMPPGTKLPETDIAALRRWIELGAPWAEADAKSEPAWAYSAEDTWELQPLKRTNPGQDAIDTFVLRKLREKSLQPAPPADRATLIRRATFDLIGLPPTPQETQAFVKDTAADREAFGKVVDRLLASPRYGERWGRHWLDVVRYADTGGYSNDFERPNAWRYRDYVIRSFNRDKPYDRFVREQIAGDEIDPKNPENLIATGFLRMGPWEQTGMSVAAETRQAWLDDVTHSAAATFLGLTMECARCHDHKFDPLPTKDYYRLQAIFATTEFADRPAAFLPEEKRDDFEAGRAHLKLLIERNHAKLAEFEAITRRRLAEKSGKSAADLPMEEVDKAVKTNKLLSAEEFEKLKVFRKREELYQRSAKRYDASAFSVSDGPFEPKEQKGWSPPDVFILPVGNLKTPGEKVTPGLISAVMRYDPAVSNDVTQGVSDRRLALANWIANPANPLTARVMVNRIWQY